MMKPTANQGSSGGGLPGRAAARPYLGLRDCRVGANPIIWSNDDFYELAGDLPLGVLRRHVPSPARVGAVRRWRQRHGAQQVGRIVFVGVARW